MNHEKIQALIDAALKLLTWAEAQRMWNTDDDELMPAIRSVRKALAEIETT